MCFFLNVVLLLQWFLDSIIRHKPVYGRYMHRLNFVYNPSLTSKLPLFNFMFQLADDSNFILYLQPLWPVPFSFYPKNIFLLLSLVFSPFPFLTTRLAPAVCKDNQGVKRKLWNGGECYCDTDSGLVMVVVLQQVLYHFSSCPYRLSVQYSVCRDEVSSLQ